MAATETASDRYAGIDLWADADALDALVGGQERAVAAVRASIPAISAAAQAIVPRLKAGGRLVYAGAGSSASIAAQDGSELPGTFGFPRERIVFLVAGGPAALLDIDGAAEDDVAAGEARCRRCSATSRATWWSPFRPAARPPTRSPPPRRAKAGGALVVGIANNPQAPLLDHGRPRRAAGHRPGGRRRLDAHGRRHGAEMRPRRPVDAGEYPPRPRA